MDEKPSRVIVTDFDMPFGKMVVFMVKVAIASIPAALILFALAGVVAVAFGIFGAVFTPALK